MSNTIMIAETRTEPCNVPTGNMPILRGKVEELNRRAERLGVEPLRIEIIDTKTITRKHDETGLEYTLELNVVEIVGESPRLDGWTLIARLTPAEGVEGENLVKCVPGLECPREFRAVDMTRCDHCHTRRFRKDTFVIHNEENGEYKVVGRNCISDFLGGVDPEALLGRASILFSAADVLDGAESDFYGGGGGHEIEIPTELFVGLTAIWMRRFGWVPRSKAEFEGATADEVWNFLMPERAESARVAKRKFAEKHSLHVTDEDREVARKAIEWARGIDRGTAKDYLYNLSLSCEPGTVKWKTRGLVASVVTAYNRHVERLVKEANRRKATADSVHLGAVKKRYVFEDCTVMMTRWFENMYGVTTLIVFRTAAGNVVKWWASGDVADDYPVGKTVTFTGTVKSHDEYKGIPETIVNRCKMGVSGKAKPVHEPNAK